MAAEKLEERLIYAKRFRLACFLDVTTHSLTMVFDNKTVIIFYISTSTLQY